MIVSFVIFLQQKYITTFLRRLFSIIQLLAYLKNPNNIVKKNKREI